MEKRSARKHTAKFKLQVVIEAEKVTMVTSYCASASWQSRLTEDLENVNYANVT